MLNFTEINNAAVVSEFAGNSLLCHLSWTKRFFSLFWLANVRYETSFFTWVKSIRKTQYL